MEEINIVKDGLLQPRKVARFLINDASKKYLFFLMCFMTILAGVASGGDNATDEVMTSGELLVGFVIAVVLSPLFGVISYGVSAFFMWIFGKIVRGRATYKTMFKALLGVNMPFIIAFPFCFAWMILKPESYSNINNMSGSPIELVSILTMLVAAVWSIVNTVAAVSEAHEITIGEAILVIFLPIILLVILLVAALVVFL